MRIVWYGTSPDYKKYIYAQAKILSHDESGHLNILGFYILTSSPGAGPWDPVSGHCRRRPWTPPEEEPFPFWVVRLPRVRRPSSSFFPPQGIHLPPPLRPLRRRNEHRTFGYCVRSAAAMKAAPGLFGLLLGRLLRHLVRRRDQHLRQKWDGRVFGQWGRTMDPLRLLRPALGELNKHALSASFGSCG